VVGFPLWVGKKNGVYKRKVDTRDKLLSRILVAAAGIKNIEDQLRRTKGDFRARVAKYIEVEGGTSENLL
jgi:hypothetical protein